MKQLRITHAVGILVLLLSARWAGAEEFERRTAIVQAIAETRDAIVNLRTMKSVPARFTDTQEGRVRGLGTGVLIDPRGYIVTNHHVVADVSQITVLTSDNTEYTAQMVNSDPLADLAVLRVDAPGKIFSYLPLWGVEEPILGELVIAIGNPYGLENSVTTGIVSAVNRKLKLPNDEVFDDLIQTDASINPGNSGGPLLTVNGDLLGINVAIRSYAQGIGFAIPTPKVREVVRRMMANAPGVITQQGLHVGPLKSKSTDLAEVVSVERVEPGSRADEVGFRVGDEILTVENLTVPTTFDLERALWGRRGGESVTFRVRRNGLETIEIPLNVLPETLSREETLVRDRIGLRLEVVAAEKVQKVYHKLNGGLRVLSVVPGSAADRAKLRPGDILVGLDDRETIAISGIRWFMLPEQSRSGPIVCHYIRNGTHEKGTIEIPRDVAP